MLLTKRLVRCKQVVIESMNKFNSNNERDFKQDESIRVERMHNVNNTKYTEYIECNDEIDSIITKCHQIIDEHLKQWKGVNSVTTTYTHFRDYFKVAKNTFDQRKRKIVASYFWIPLITIITQV